MAQESCNHEWKMINVHLGYVVTEKCYHCSNERNYFTLEDNPPFEEYREGVHLWNIMGTSQTKRFDLVCEKCNQAVKLQELYGLMMCTGCDKECPAGKLQASLEPERTWVYVAFGFLPLNERKQLSKEQIKVIEEYFNQGLANSRSKIKIVPQSMVRDMNNCYGLVIKDDYMLDLEVPL
jgi:protein-arginine kinase activator protein McsA